MPILETQNGWPMSANSQSCTAGGAQLVRVCDFRAQKISVKTIQWQKLADDQISLRKISFPTVPAPHGIDAIVTL